jgi:hypothetical protein
MDGDTATGVAVKGDTYEFVGTAVERVADIGRRGSLDARGVIKASDLFT